MKMNIGKIESIFRYPIKSIRGEKLFEVSIDENGVKGDRIFAFKDCQTGLIVSCKHPKKWKKLLELSATLNKDNSIIVKDDYNTKWTNNLEIETRIYELTSRSVKLESVSNNKERQFREADRSNVDNLGAEILQESLSIASKSNHFFDFAPLHLITSSSLSHIKKKYEEGDFDAQRFRPNLIIKTNEEHGFLENEWLGKKIMIGDELIIKIIEPSPRCVLVTLKQGKLKEDKEILRTIVNNSSAKSYTYFPGKILKGTLGVYAIIINQGKIKLGDKVRLIKE